MLRACLSTLLFIAGAVAAPAETTIVLKPNDRPMMQGVEQARVSVGISMFVPLADGGDQVIKAQEDARRVVYDLAERECGILREVLASEAIGNRSTSTCSAISSGNRRTAGPSTAMSAFALCRSGAAG
jgi:hypothetical protein